MPPSASEAPLTPRTEGLGARSVRWSAEHPWLVLGVALLLCVGGELARRSLASDVLPELSDPRLTVAVDWMGHPATEVATEVTAPLTQALSDVPGVSAVRGGSMSGMAFLDVVFRSAAAVPPGRREIEDRLGALRPRLPATARVSVGPDAASVGWIYQYALVDPTHGTKPVGLRRFQDAVARPALAALPGVAEVASVGGDLEALWVDVRSEQLRDKALAFSDVVSSVSDALQRRAVANPGALGELEVTAVPSAPTVKLREVAQVRLGHDMPSGLADLAGNNAAVGGIVIAQRGANVLRTLEGVHRAVDALRSQLPPGVKLVTVHDRSEVIGRIQHTLSRALLEEIAVVAAVILLFLLSFRAAVVPLLTLPVIVLGVFGAMGVLGLPATLMSLGGMGIALGMAVDADVIALEACHRGLESLPAGASGEERRRRLIRVAGVFGPAVLTALFITALSFLPVLGFSGEAGRLLRPLAITKTLVILAAAAVALTVAPALRELLLRGPVRAELDHPLTRILIGLYRPFVGAALERPVLTLGIALAALLSCIPVALHLGQEFLPRVDEGDLLFMPTTAPGAPMEELPAQLRLQDSALTSVPEVATVFGKMGRADTATDPAPLSMVETTLRLRPRDTWPASVHEARWWSAWAPGAVRPLLDRLWPEHRAVTTAELVERLDRQARLPGWSSAWTAPVRARMDMVATGVRTAVGIRVSAADPLRLEQLGEAVRALALAVPGTRSAVTESIGGERRLDFVPDPESLKALGVEASLVSRLTELWVSGGQVGELDQGGRALRVRVVQDQSARGPLDQLRALTLRASPSSPQPIPLALLGHPEVRTVPASLHSEGGQLTTVVQLDLEAAIELGSYVRRAQQALRRAQETGGLVLRPGERVDFIGQYPLLLSAERRLWWIVPAVLLSMLVLLYWQFRSLAEALIILASVPFALVGSIWTLHWLGYPLSAPVWVGLLSVVGLAMQTAVVMVVYIDDAFHRRVAEGRLRTRQDIVEAHAEGTVRRLRPKVMTVATLAAGLLPFLWAEGPGSEIMRRVAAPMVGGLLTSAFLTLEVLPVLYTLWRTHQLRSAERRGLDPATAFYRRTGAEMEGTPLVSTRKSM